MQKLGAGDEFGEFWKILEKGTLILEKGGPILENFRKFWKKGPQILEIKENFGNREKESVEFGIQSKRNPPWILEFSRFFRKSVPGALN